MATTDRMGSTFVGREPELALLRERLDEARAGEPRMVLVEGPAGIGKTALLQRLVATTDDVRLLRAGAVREESLLPYGVAEQLARSARVPLPEDLAALGRRSERSPEPIAVGAAFVDLLGTLQRDGPVLMVLDDVQWADRPTLLALLFALRRLHADRVLALVAGREETKTHVPEGLLRLFSDEHGTTIRLHGLDVSELQALGATLTRTPLPRQLAEHLREHTGGSPLHVRSLLEELPLERLGQASETPLPPPQSFSAQVLSRLAGCPADARRLVDAASVLGIECELSLTRRLAEIEDPLMALDGAMSARLLEARDTEGERRIAFPHALVRAAVYHDVGLARRAALHERAAALVQDVAESLQHRVAAASEQDDGLAADLAGYARREAARGAPSRAAAALLQAARLSSTAAERQARMLEGAACLLEGGDVTTTADLAPEIGAMPEGAARSYVLGRLAFLSGRPAEAEALLLRAWEACEGREDGGVATRIAMELALLLMRRARGAETVRWAQRALATAEGTPFARWPLAYFAYGSAYAGRAGEALAAFSFLPHPIVDVDSEHAWTAAGRGQLRVVTDDLVGARADLSVAVEAGARWGPLFGRLANLTVQSIAEFRLGAFDDAILHAELAASLGEDAGLVWGLTASHGAAAAPLAARGDWDPARAHADAAARFAEVVRDEAGVADAGLARAQIAAARTDHAGVIEALRPIVEMTRREGIDEPGTRWPWQELYADALLSLGRLEEAETVLVALEERASLRMRHSAMLNAARVRGHLESTRGREDVAERAFVEGLAHAEAVSVPFDQARLEAAYGGFLRRLGRRAEALTLLKAAQARFVRLGARPYLERCDAELAACGVARGRPRDPDRSKLTPQELSVAKLVASGLSNPRVATELFVSINTVEFHLKNVFGKLGIRSRDQLRERMAPS